MNRLDVFKELDKEREYQINKWKDLDNRNNVSDFLCYMKRFYDAAVVDNNPDLNNATLRNIKKITALGVACMEKFGTGD